MAPSQLKTLLEHEKMKICQ